jgi:glutamyl-tRNA synthetase
MSGSVPITRFAPSPTGHLHIGGVRTALFNFLFAKNQGGQLILRIEDTDLSRSSKEMAAEILEGLRWLGIQWDQGPVYQSDRFARYRETAFRLLEENKAYRCFCTPEELAARRKASEASDCAETLYKYDRHCLGLPPGQITENLERRVPFVIRFLIPEGATYFKDRLHKEMKVDNSELEDFVILKSDNSPTYQLSVVADDSDMGITDVVRGDDHISNTFKQVLLFRALELKPPKYAHLPLILGPDKKKLSKRHGETSVLEFQRNGYLPEAVLNYLCQLSWLPADSKKLFSLPELIRQFSLGKVSKSSPVFDYDKLRYLNSLAIQQREAGGLLSLLEENPGFRQQYTGIDPEKKVALIELVKPRMKTLVQLEEKFEIYIKGGLNYGNDDLTKLNETYDRESIKKHLQLLLVPLEILDSDAFDSETLERLLRDCAESNGLQAADLIHPLRFALTSETVSPSIFEVLAFLGKKETLERINALLSYLDRKND